MTARERAAEALRCAADLAERGEVTAWSVSHACIGNEARRISRVAYANACSGADDFDYTATLLEAAQQLDEQD